MRRLPLRALVAFVASTSLFAAVARADGPTSGPLAGGDPAPPPPPPLAPPLPAPLPSTGAASTATPSVVQFPVTFATGERRLELLDVTNPPPGPADGASAGPRTRYTTVCLGPCTKLLAAGGHEFALRRPDGKAVPAGTLDLSGAVTVGATYESHAARRVLGLPVLLGGLGGGLGLFTATNFPTTTLARDAEFAGGTVLVAAAVIAGYLLLTKGDEGHVFVAPLAGTAPSASGSAPMPVGPGARGAAVGVPF